MNLLFLDLETSGLCPIKCGVIQMAGIIEKIDPLNFNPKSSRIIDSFHYNCRLQKNINLVLEKGTSREEKHYIAEEIIEPEALVKTGKTAEEIMSYDDPVPISRELIKKFSGIVGRGKKETREKLIIVGANPRFDRQFFDYWFRKCYYDYPHGLLDWWIYDVQSLAFQFKMKGKLPVENYRVETLAKYFNIPLKAHDALEDIIATRKIFYILMDALQVNEPNALLEIPDPKVIRESNEDEEELEIIL